MPTLSELVDQVYGKRDASVPQTVGLSELPSFDPKRLNPNLAVPETQGLQTLSALPYGFRKNIYMLRDRPADLGRFLKSKGFEIEAPDISGRVVIKDGSGSRYDLNQELPGQAAVYHLPAIVLQTLGTAAGTATGIPGGTLAGIGAGSVAADAYQALLRRQAGIEEKPAELLTQAAGDVALNLATEGVFRGAGMAGRSFLGKSTAKKAADEAFGEQFRKQSELGIEALKTADAARAVARESVESRQASVNKMMALNAEKTFDKVRDQEVEKRIATALGGPPAPKVITLEDLTHDVMPVQRSVGKSVGAIFGGLSQKYQETLLPFKDSTMRIPFADVVETQLADVASELRSVSPSLGTLLAKAKELDPTFVGKSKASSTVERAIATMRDRGMPEEVLQQIRRDATSKPLLGEVTSYRPGGQTVIPPSKAPQTGATVENVLGLNSELEKVMRTSKNSTDKRVASNMLSFIRDAIASQDGLPPETRAILGELNSQWHEASSLFEGFRGKLFRTTSPETVANLLMAGDPKRASLVVDQVRKNSPDELPMLRSAVADNVFASGNLEKRMNELDPSLFQRLFPETGFESPKAWTAAMREGIKKRDMLDDPALRAKFSVAFDQGMKSVGAKAREAALLKAEEKLSRVPDAMKTIEDALRDVPTPQQAAESAGIKAAALPILARNPTLRYIEHRIPFETALALLSTGGGLAMHNPVAFAAGWTYILSSRGMSAALANPARAKKYYQLITAKGPEQAGFWAGRLAASSLAELAKGGPGYASPSDYTTP